MIRTTFLMFLLMPILLMSGCGDDGSMTSGGSSGSTNGDTPQLVNTTGNTACQILNPSPITLNNPPLWTGSCSNGLAYGTGTLTLSGSLGGASDTLTETGTFNSGVPNGKISMNFISNFPPNQIKYAGSIVFNAGIPIGPLSIESDQTLNGYENSSFEKSDSIDTYSSGATIVAMPLMSRNCSAQFTSSGQILFSETGVCSKGSLVTGTAIGYYPDGSIEREDTGTFNPSSAGISDGITIGGWPPDLPNDYGLVSGLSYLYPDKRSTAIEILKGDFSPNGALADGEESQYDNRGNLEAIEQGSFQTINNHNYLEGLGEYATSNGALLNGKWIDGCFNDKYPEIGYDSCAALSAAASSDKIQDAEAAQEDAQKQAASDAYQQQQEQFVQHEINNIQQENQNILAQTADNLAIGQQNIAAQVQNMQIAHAQVEQDLVARNQKNALSPIAVEPHAAPISEQVLSPLPIYLGPPLGHCLTIFLQPDPNIPGRRHFAETNTCSQTIWAGTVVVSGVSLEDASSQSDFGGVLQPGETLTSDMYVDASNTTGRIDYDSAVCPDGYNAVIAEPGGTFEPMLRADYIAREDFKCQKFADGF